MTNTMQDSFAATFCVPIVDKNSSLTYAMKTAPAFYITQFDLTRPFKANSKHNKRTTLKIWLVVFGCVTTITINIKVMEDYSTTTFFQAFTRISYEVGYPKKLSPDEGSRSSKNVHK